MHKWNWDILVCLSHENGCTTATENFEKGVLALLMGYENWSGVFILTHCTKEPLLCNMLRTEIFANLHVFQQILQSKMQERDDVPTDF